MHRVVLTAAAVMVPFLAGCWGADLAPVQGTVTLDGKPLAGATVTFVPEKEGQAAHSISGDDGRFVLDTHGRNGAKPGKYEVMIFKIDPNAPKTAARPKSVIPDVYSTKGKSPFSVTIPHSGPVTLDLKSDAK